MTFHFTEELGLFATRTMNAHHLNNLLPIHGIKCAIGLVVPAGMSITQEELYDALADGALRRIAVPGRPDVLVCYEVGEYDLLVFEYTLLEGDERDGKWKPPSWALGYVFSDVNFANGSVDAVGNAIPDLLISTATSKGKIYSAVDEIHAK